MRFLHRESENVHVHLAHLYKCSYLTGVQKTNNNYDHDDDDDDESESTAVKRRGAFNRQ